MLLSSRHGPGMDSQPARKKQRKKKASGSGERLSCVGDLDGFGLLWLVRG